MFCISIWALSMCGSNENIAVIKPGRCERMCSSAALYSCFQVSEKLSALAARAGK